MAEDLRARKSPSTSGEIYGYLPRGCYNVQSVVENDGYRWAGIADSLFAAIVEGASEYRASTDTREMRIEKAIKDIISVGQNALK